MLNTEMQGGGKVMSFSLSVRDELLKQKISTDEEVVSLAAIILFAKKFSQNEIYLQTESKAVIEYAYKLLIKYFPDVGDFVISGSFKKQERDIYYLSVEDKKARKILFYELTDSKKQSVTIREDFFSDTKSFLRGVFLSCGNIYDPNRSYRVEFKCYNIVMADFLSEKLNLLDIKFSKTFRDRNIIFLIKDSSSIEDLLTAIGAHNQSLQLMNIKVLKDIRNRANRITNFENANIDKSVAAAVLQIAAINKIKNAGRFDNLSLDIAEVAEVRLQNPEASLNELLELLSFKTNKSSLNYKLKKIISISEGIK